ncbi:MAG TPA: DUF3048 domain-containing protein [Acidimicrobiia bacterium]
MRRPLIVLALTFAVVAAACGGGGDDTTAQESKRTTTTAPPPTAPLTGLPDPDGAAQGRPALTVKVDNLDGEGVRPQSGLDRADVVYEEVTEGDITRFAAIFQSQVPDEVGPIRSVRSIDPDLVTPIGGIFAYSGGAPANVEKLLQAPVNSVDESQAGDAMFRVDTKEAPHNLFGRGQLLLDKGGQPVPPPPLFPYLAEGEAFAGEAIAAFTVGFQAGYAPTYAYDAATRTWRRDIAGTPFVMADGTQIAPTNVIVQFTEYTGGGEGNVLGEGDAWVFSDGQLVRGRWQRPSVDQPAQYVDALSGQPIKLLPGTTWVELLPVLAPVDLVPAAPPAPAPST